MMLPGFFRSTDNVYHDHISMCNIQRPFYCLRSIATFSLNFDAMGIPTTDLDEVLE